MGTMRALAMSWYKDFECIGGKCPLTCCTTWWNILLRDEEIETYQKLQHPLQPEILKAIDFEKKKMKGEACDYCRLLTEDGWCRIVRECGEEYLSKTCKEYPRQRVNYGDVQEMVVDISCPHAASFLFKDAEIMFDYEEGDVAAEDVFFQYSTYDALSGIRNLLIELWQSDIVKEQSGKFYVTLHLFFRLRNMIQKRGDDYHWAEKMLKTYSKQETLQSLSDRGADILAERECYEGVLHYFFSKTANLVINFVLIPAQGQYDLEQLNEWLCDREMFIEDITGYLEYFRETYPSMINNYFVYILFFYWMKLEPEKKDKAVLNEIFLIRYVEWFWIQIIAAANWKKHGRVEAFGVMIADIDRIFSHSDIVSKELLHLLKELDFDRDIRMVLLTLF